MSELRKLAEDALSLNEPWWDLGDDRVSMSFCDQDAAYIAAANPTIVIGLLDEIERLTAERDAAIADAKRYRWLCENGDADGGLFIGTGRNGTWGECGHSAYHYKEHADAAIDKAMKGATMSEIKTAEQRIHKLEGGEGDSFVTVEQALIAERDELRAALADRDAKLAALEPFDDWPDYHSEAMGCGLEDRNITDRYEAMQYGWDQALDRVAERLEGYAAAGAAPVPEGWQLVPVEPTQEMLDAADHGRYSGGLWAQYRNMLAAAPKDAP